MAALHMHVTILCKVPAWWHANCMAPHQPCSSCDVLPAACKLHAYRASVCPRAFTGAATVLSHACNGPLGTHSGRWKFCQQTLQRFMQLLATHTLLHTVQAAPPRFPNPTNVSRATCVSMPVQGVNSAPASAGCSQFAPAYSSAK